MRCLQHLFAALFIGLIASHASAESCPKKYRFVDFGDTDQNGTLRKGGTIFRAFDASNTHLLHRDSVICHAVPENGIDGRALKIPVVSRFAIDLDIAKLNLAEMQLAKSEDVIAAADQNAARHRATLAKAGTETVKSDSYLCAQTAASPRASCQVLSPYQTNAALVIYCNQAMCEMPVLVYDEQVIVSAKWLRGAAELTQVGGEISRKIYDIVRFLAPHLQSAH